MQTATGITSVALVIAIVGLVGSFGVGNVILGIGAQSDVIAAHRTLPVGTAITYFSLCYHVMRIYSGCRRW